VRKMVNLHTRVFTLICKANWLVGFANRLLFNNLKCFDV